MIPVHRMVGYTAIAREIPMAQRLVGPIRRLIDLPVTDVVRRRPVFDRYVRRKHYMLPVDPPTEAEKRDAILILADEWEDDLSEEALRILDESEENGEAALR